MARTHVWKFLVNQAGEPIEGANVSIYKAGTTTPVWVYFDEFAAGGSRTSPQVGTLENGYFEFWIDELEDFDVCNIEDAEDDLTATSYGFNQKFKVQWDKPGIAQGYVDYIDVFPANRYFQAANFDNCSEPSIQMNKLISDYYACKWDGHSDSDIRVIPNPSDIHGLEYLDTTQPNDTFNKIVTNNQGWLWDVHELTNVYEYSLSGSSLGGQSYTKAPHDLWPVNILNTLDTKVNKVVSNDMMREIREDIDATKAGIFTITDVGGGGDFNWVLVGGQYEADIPHNLDILFPDVTAYGNQGSPSIPIWMMEKTAEVQYVDINTIKIIIATDMVDMTVRITT